MANDLMIQSEPYKNDRVFAAKQLQVRESINDLKVQAANRDIKNANIAKIERSALNKQKHLNINAGDIFQMTKLRIDSQKPYGFNGSQGFGGGNTFAW